jgi:malate dehydrogenase
MRAQDKLFPRLRDTQRPLHVLVTGAAGNIAYALIFMIAKGDMFGPHQTLSLHLLDIPPMAEALKGVEMELIDGAFPLVKEIVVTTDVKTAFTNVEVGKHLCLMCDV